MRKILTLTLMLGALGLSAREVTPQEAEAAASEFLQGTLSKKLPAKSLKRVKGAVSTASNEPYYVFNAEGDNGFVIISGNDSYSKILGYSERGSFDLSNLPPQLKGLLESFSRRSEEAGDSKETHVSWKSASRAAATEGVLLPTASWGQGAPYNADCPEVSGEKAPTGCVATAMSIIMKYHNWPERYDWDAMPLEMEYDAENMPVANPAVAKLMRDAGEAVHMSYGSLESGAHMNWVGHKMQQEFQYAPDCQFISSANFSNEEWVKLLKGNLDEGNPVIYQGTNDDYSQNHAFVLDGYNSNGYHINWGWDGYCNGYYALDALTPNEVQDFSLNNGMVINLVPDKSGKVYSECFTDYGYFWATAGTGTHMNLSVENLKKDETFQLINTIMTLPSGFEGLVGLALVDKNDKIKEVISTTYNSTYSPSDGEYFDMGIETTFFDVKVSVDIDPTDRLQLVTKNQNDNDFKLVLGTLEGPSSVVVAGNTPQYGTVDVEIGKNVKFVYDFGYGERNIELSEGKTVIKGLEGTSMFFICEPMFPEKDPIVAMTLKGKKLIGLGNLAGERFSYSIPVGDDSRLTVRIPELKDSEITLSEAGTLKDKISEDEAINIKNLTLSGKINALDFWYIRDHMPALHSLDIRNVNIEEVDATDGYFSQEPVKNQANVIPVGALSALGMMESVFLPDNLEGIADNSMMGLNIKTLSIPAGVKFIGLNAFNSNKNLEAVEILNPEPFGIQDCVFHNSDVREKGILFVPEGTSSLYGDVADWSNFQRIIEGRMPENVVGDVTVDNIKYHYLYDTARVNGYEGNPVDVTLAGKIRINDKDIPVTRIYYGAFNECRSLKSIVIPEEVTEIGERSFHGASDLKSVRLGKNLKKIGREAFYMTWNLEECDIPSSVEEIGLWAFLCTGMKQVTIPKNACPQNDLGCFGGMSGLDKFVVEDGNPYFKEIDGVLYRVVEDGLILECVPGLKSGRLVLPDNCIKVWENSMSFLSGLEEVVFNPGLETIERWAVNGESLEHITLPKNAFIYERAISGSNIKSVTFTGALKNNSQILDTPDIESILIESPDETVDMDGIFTQSVENVNIFSSSLNKNYTYSDDCVLYVPGRAGDGYGKTRSNEVKEMWVYVLNREDHELGVFPTVDGLTVDKVTVNGKELQREGNVFVLPATDKLDVEVNYTLFGRQPMKTHYTAEFNVNVPDEEVSGVIGIDTADNKLVDVYGLDGTVLKKGCDLQDINELTPGIYILRQGNKTRKVVINK